MTRIPPAKYLWGQLPELHGYLNGIIAEAARVDSVPVNITAPRGVDDTIHPSADLLAAPFADVGGAICRRW